MKAMTIEALFDMPSLSDSYVVAGNNGMFREVVRIDILETPFPEVEKYLEKGELIFTSFWNSRENPQARIQLVQAMIKHDCAGIGIMPGLYLDNIIDPEIIQVGNEYNFPIIVLNTDSRWSDVIREFYEHSRDSEPQFVPHIYDFMCLVDIYREGQNLALLGHRLESMLKIPIIIFNNGEYFFPDLDDCKKVVSKIETIFYSKSYTPYTPVTPYVSRSVTVDCIFGKDSYITAVVTNENTLPGAIEAFREVGTYLVKLFESDNQSVKQHLNSFSLMPTEQYHFFFIRKDNISKYINRLKNECILYDYNTSLNSAIGLWRCDPKSKKSIYQLCGELMSNLKPQSLIFSEDKLYSNQINELASYVFSEIKSIQRLDGIFTVGELTILKLLSIAPSEVGKRINNLNNTLHANLHEKPAFWDTLRLYMILHSIKKVADLLGIHPNTVKYRIEKSFELKDDVDTNICNLEMLVFIENMKLN